MMAKEIIIGEIAAASAEQSSGIDQVNRAVTQMDHVVQSNATQTEEVSSTAQALTVQADQLKSLVSRFKLAGDLSEDERITEPIVRTSKAPTIAPIKSPKACYRNGSEVHQQAALEDL